MYRSGVIIILLVVVLTLLVSRRSSGLQILGVGTTQSVAEFAKLDWVSRMAVAAPSSVPLPKPLAAPKSTPSTPPPAAPKATVPSSVTAVVGRMFSPSTQTGYKCNDPKHYIENGRCFTGEREYVLGGTRRESYPATPTRGCRNPQFPALIDINCYGSCPTGYAINPKDAKSCTRA